MLKLLTKESESEKNAILESIKKKQNFLKSAETVLEFTEEKDEKKIYSEFKEKDHISIKNLSEVKKCEDFEIFQEKTDFNQNLDSSNNLFMTLMEKSILQKQKKKFFDF